MLEVVQAGQAGKTQLLFEMHRFRARVFRERMGWDVDVDENGLEIDEFDTPDAVYLLALDQDSSVVGTWRMIPSTGPTMVCNVWPHFLNHIDLPHTPNVWEMSRFAVSPHCSEARAFVATSKRIVGEMFCGLTELCIRAGIREVFTLYDQRIERIVEGLQCSPVSATPRHPIGDFSARVGLFRTDFAMLTRLRASTGIATDILPANLALPPAMRCLNIPKEALVSA